MIQKIINKNTLLGILSIILFACTNSSEQTQTSSEDHWRFVSMPDFLNVDTDYPQQGWEDALSFVLEAVKKENPEFLTVAGDIVMGHWHGEKEKPDIEGIKHYADRYYTAWKARMDAHGLQYYTSIGDHEIGDNPWNYSNALENVEAYKKEFREHMGMPLNGPEHMKGTAFYWKHKNVLFVSVDVFEVGNSDQGKIKADVSGKQLEWFENVLEQNQDVEHVIVLGHTPVLGPVRKWSSSGLMLTAGRNSMFWKTMAKYKVVLYICGEVHTMTCTERDGVQQIAHGGLFGYNPRVNYLVVDVYPDKLELTLKELDILPSGEKLWQAGTNRPLENIDIAPEVREKGYSIVGKLTVDTSTSHRKFENAKGYFLKKHETSNLWGLPVFHKNYKPLPRIGIND